MNSPSKIKNLRYLQFIAVALVVAVIAVRNKILSDHWAKNDVIVQPIAIGTTFQPS